MSSKCCCNSKDEREIRLKEVIEKNKDTKGALIPVLHEAQALYGYLPLEVQKFVSEEMDISLAEIYGVVTFYTEFSLKPKGKYNFSVCMGTACYVKGAGAVLDKLKEKLGLDVGDCSEDGNFSLEACRCIGACGLAPVMTVNKKVYGTLVPGDIENIIKEYNQKV